MKKKQIIGHVDQHGELHKGGTFVYIPPKKTSYSKLYGDQWMVAAQAGFLRVACDSELKGAEMKTLLYMMGRIGFENYVCIPQTEIIEKTGYTKKSVAAAIKTLEQKGILIVGPKNGRSKSWKLDPNFGYKGTPAGKVRRDKAGHLKLVSNNKEIPESK